MYTLNELIEKANQEMKTLFNFDSETKEYLNNLGFDKFSDLVILIAFIISNQGFGNEMILDLVERKHKGYKPLFMEEGIVLGETYGRLVYKEQFNQLVQAVTGWDLEKSDMLRRDMAKRKYENVCKEELRFIECAINKGFPDDTARVLYKKLYGASTHLISRTFCENVAKLFWLDSYLMENSEKTTKKSNYFVALQKKNEVRLKKRSDL